MTALLVYFCPCLNLLLYGEKSGNDNPEKGRALGVTDLLWGCQESCRLDWWPWPAAEQVCNFSSGNGVQFEVSENKKKIKHMFLLNTFCFQQTSQFSCLDVLRVHGTT